MKKSASWVVVSRETGEAVMETFSKAVAQRINLQEFKVVPIKEYLYSLNRKSQNDVNRSLT